MNDRKRLDNMHVQCFGKKETTCHAITVFEIYEN